MIYLIGLPELIAIRIFGLEPIAKELTYLLCKGTGHIHIDYILLTSILNFNITYEIHFLSSNPMQTKNPICKQRNRKIKFSNATR